MTDARMDPLRTRELLGRSALFSGVDLSMVDAEIDQTRQFVVSQGQVLLDPGRVNGEVFVILEGEMLVCLEPRIGNPLVRLGPGACAGELSIIDTSPPSAYVVAATDVSVVAINKETLWAMLAKQQAMAFNLLHILAQRIRENNQVLLGSLELQRQYRSKAETDALTGLHNRVWFEEVFPKQLELCERTGQHASLLMVDIDHFKLVNDRHGHGVGDDALRHIAMLLRRNLRATDLCARYGGEEMIVLMPGADSAHAKLTADRLRESIAATSMRLPDGSPLNLHVSGGIAQWQPGLRLVDLIRHADQALYCAKDQGRNQIVVSALAASWAG